MRVTAFYAALLTPIFIFISLRVIRARRDAKASIGDGGNSELLRRMRVQANFAEYVPLALILLALAESLSTPGWLLHVLGMTLLLGRIVHAFGVSQANEQFAFRVSGVALTITMLICTAAVCFYKAIAF
jgi:uncharacterized membrane protein YecN with MAPEG domain